MGRRLQRDSKGARDHPLGLFLRRRRGRWRRQDEGPAGRQGRQPGGDERAGPAGAARPDHHHRGLRALLRRRPQLSLGAGGPGEHRPGQGGGADRQGVRRCRQPAAGLGALRRAGVHAGHDGHGAEPGPQRRDGGGAGQAVGGPPLRLRQLPPVHPDVFQRGAGAGARPVRGDPGRSQGPAGGHRRHGACRVRLGEGGGRLQGRRGARTGPILSPGPARPALGRHRGGVRELDERAGQVLSPDARHPGELGHGGERAVDGVRQHGRHLRHRRRLHPQPVDG